MENLNEQFNAPEQNNAQNAPSEPQTEHFSPAEPQPWGTGSVPQGNASARFTPPQFTAPSYEQSRPSTPSATGGYIPFNSYDGGSIPQFVAPAPKKKKTPVWPFVVFGIIGFILVLSLLVGLISWALSTDGTSLPTGEDYVAVMYIDSEIAGDYVTTSLYGTYSSYNQVYFIDTLAELAEDGSNVGLMLYINTPGGEVTATDELSRAIVNYKNETGRPVYAYFSDMAASGGYWIGCHADKIIASKFCTTGSIGVTYGTHLEVSKLLEKLGITVTELTAGDNKAMGSMYSPLTDEQKAMYEEQLNEMHELFVNTVAANRSLPADEVRKIADGRTFLASKALEYKLVDEIGYWEDARRIMTEECNLGGEVLFYDCIPEIEYATDSLSLLYGMLKDNGTAADADSVAALVDAINQNRRFMAIYN